MLPEAFEFPKCDIICAWSLWWSGNSERRWPPLCLVRPEDLFQRNKEKYYLSGSAFSRFWNKKIQTSPFGVENALSLMKT